MSVRIGALKMGGIGDMCDLAVLLTGIRRAHKNASITAIIDVPVMKNIIGKYADAVIVNTQREWNAIFNMEAWKYDLFYDLRPHRGLVFKGDVYKHSKKLIGDGKYGKPDERIPVHVTLEHIHAWKHYNSWQTHKLQHEGKSVIQLNAEAIGIAEHIPNGYDDARCDIPAIDMYADYITINTGAMGSEKGIKQTKQWEHDRWQQVVDVLVREGYKVLHIGRRWEKKLKGCTDYIWNKPLSTVMQCLEASKLHLGVENGIVRLRRLVTDKPSIVLFGPTHPVMYGFDNNVNLWLNVCKPCFWFTSEWMHECAMQWNCLCMKSITPEMVLAKIYLGREC